MDRKEAITAFMDKVKKLYIEDQLEKGITASGASAKSLRTEASYDGGQLYGFAYLRYQFDGRRAGKMPPVEKIIQWLKDKTSFRIEFDRTKGLRSLAWAIAKKIAKQGTDINQGKRPGLSIQEKLEDSRRELAKELLKGTREEVIERFKIRSL